ncbi:MAG: branched-chain amino acid ABC transporter ATP-binding protein/permease [Proteobacteria bacterium]|nr:branched-chain amino acid ABC transporter ATP-binding protein/permease [Pseudomonadota bacterium]MBU1451822.1 branched-chain amino acid ABC transporter ATP-binding protein/permease [Pseudomonadota bacterium]
MKGLSGIGLLVALSPFWVGNPFYTDIIVTILYYAALSLAWNLVGGYAGQFSLGHTSFFGVGAYTSTLLFLNLDISPWFGMLAGGVLAAIMALLIFTPCFRLKGFYFCLVSIALAEVLRIIAVYWRGLTMGGVGLLLPVKPAWQNFLFESKYPYLIFALLLLLIMIGVTYWLGRSKLGYYLQAIREDESAAKAVGINVVRCKTIIMMISAFFTAVSGTFYAQYMMFIDPDIVFSMHMSIQVALFAIIGGVGTLAGPVLGAFLLVPLDAVMKGWLGTIYAGLGFVVYGAILIAVVMLMPDGIVKSAEAWMGRRRPKEIKEVEYLEDAVIPPPALEPPPGEILHVKGLCKSFGGLNAIYELDLSVRRGEIVGVIGPNGAGKTTLFSLISTFLKPDRGSVSFCGQDLGQMAPHSVCAMGLSRTFQVVRPFMHLSVLDNVATACLLRDPHVPRARERALEVLRFVGLGDQAHKPASSLTLPNRKRVELARALATRPSLILLDEVMAGLNPSEIRQIIELVRRISATGITLVVIEHVMKAIMSLSDRIVVINYGQKIAEGTPQEIVANPLVIEAYLGKETAHA